MSDAPIDDPTSIEPTPETITFDSDGDGIEESWASTDGTSTVIVSDLDGDGISDWVGGDGTGDGELDVEIYRDGDTVRIIANESFAGGPIDETMSVDEFESKYPGLIDSTLDAPWPAGTVTPDAADSGFATQPHAPYVAGGEIHGDPTQYSDNWFAQGFNGACVPASIAQIYNVYSGTDYSDVEFVQIVNEQQAWGVSADSTPYMTLEGAETVFESQGIPVTIENSDVSGLIDALDSGTGIVVAVDSGEYWTGEAAEDNTADHAVVIAAIDEENGVVYLSDTGTPDGNMLAVPIDTFLDAWADSGNQMLVCDQPAPGFEVAPQADAATAVGAAETVVGETHRATASAVGDVPSEPTVSLITEATRAEFANVVNWVVTNPWIILPVVLAVRGLIKK